MSIDKEFIVRFSRKKIIGMISNVVFVITILLFLYLLNGKSNGGFAIFQKIVSPIIIVFLILVLVNMIRNLRSVSPALIINPHGITDNSSQTSAGLIPWKEISKVYATKISSEKLLTIEINNPEKLFSQGNLFKRVLRRLNNIISKGSIHISANSLDIGFDELKEKVGEFYEKYGRA